VVAALPDAVVAALPDAAAEVALPDAAAEVALPDAAAEVALPVLAVLAVPALLQAARASSLQPPAAALAPAAAVLRCRPRRRNPWIGNSARRCRPAKVSPRHS
jgi:hypothetical protein